MKLKDTLQHIWWDTIGNGWWWLLVGIVILIVLIIFVIAIAILRISNVLIHPELIGEYFGKIVSGFNSIK